MNDETIKAMNTNETELRYVSPQVDVVQIVVEDIMSSSGGSSTDDLGEGDSWEDLLG